ncbi:MULTISPECIES: hypothetical protein [Pseudomonas]|nr:MULTISPECIES: hypothetical protein [Pseudomonas]MBD8239564.1 hypothetical protein [Pseudomonas fluorescens]MDY0898683.1 hypothetical protein [Pseudomonas fluorescens]
MLKHQYCSIDSLQIFTVQKGKRNHQNDNPLALRDDMSGGSIPPVGQRFL